MDDVMDEFMTFMSIKPIVGSSVCAVKVSRVFKQDSNMTPRIRYTNKGIFEYQSNVGHTCDELKKKKSTYINTDYFQKILHD